MRQLIVRAAVAASLLGCSGMAVAHVVISSPAPNGIPGQVPAIQQSAQTVNQPGVTANGVSAESSAEIWQQAIQAPPEGKISARSRKAMEAALVAAYEAGKTQNLPPIAGTNGEVVYAYGQSLPTLVTAPLHTSLILLRRGMEHPQGQGLSPGYWQVKTLKAGNQPELAVTPRFAGLHGNLVITGSSPSGKPLTYVIEVTSDAKRYTPMIGFYYPGSIEFSWKQDQSASTAKARAVREATVATLPSINAADLNFAWKMHCAGGGWFSRSDCHSILPERVFDDGKQTFIQFKPGQGNHGGIPSILAENAAGQPAIINTTFRDGYYIVDGVPHKILLLAGKGSSGKVVKLIHERR